MTDAEAYEREKVVESLLHVAARRGMTSDKLHATEVGTDRHGNPILAWSPERTRVHQRIVDELYRRNFANVPSDGRAVVTGGPGGAGKSTVLVESLGPDLKKYGQVNPDDAKEILARDGLTPRVEGLSPLETSALVHEESAHIAKLLANRAYAEKKNVAWDISMSSPRAVKSRLNDLRRHGYTDVSAIFVDVPVGIATRRAVERWRLGVDEWRAGRGLGGRYFPPRDIQKTSGTEPVSTNRRTFDQVRSEFDSWELWRNDGPRPELVKKS